MDAHVGSISAEVRTGSSTSGITWKISYQGSIDKHTLLQAVPVGMNVTVQHKPEPSSSCMNCYARSGVLNFCDRHHCIQHSTVDYHNAVHSPSIGLQASCPSRSTTHCVQISELLSHQ